MFKIELSEDIKGFVEWLRTGQWVDLSYCRYDKVEFGGSFLNLDISHAKIDRLEVSGFVCHLDVSGSKIKELVLKGTFLVVDASKSKIGKLDDGESDILIFDESG